MKDIRIDKERLLTKLQENREAHEKAFHEASEEFYKEFKEKLRIVSDCVAERTANYREAMRSLQKTQPPQGHCDEYDRQIQMLEYEENDIVVLTPQEFTQFVMDEWHWKDEFAASYTQLTKKRLARSS